MTGSRSLADLVDGLGPRERSLLAAAAQLRLLRGDQVQRLFFHQTKSEAGAARLCRRMLGRLVDQQLLVRLEGRRIGGIRAGSRGHVYALTAKGRRLHHYLSGRGMSQEHRGVHEPSVAFVAHTLAIGDLYLSLVEAERVGKLELLDFQSEPDCWRTYTGPTGAAVVVKPDALVRIATADYEYDSFVEIDCGTVGRAALLRKSSTYLGYYRSGREQAQHGLFPRVVWIGNTPQRARYLAKLLAAANRNGNLFAVTTTASAVGVLAGQAKAMSEGTPR